MNHTLQALTSLHWLQREMGGTSIDSDVSTAEAEMNDTPHCATQGAQAKGITKIILSSTVSRI